MKILKILILIIITAQIAGLVFLLMTPEISRAENGDDALKFKPQIPIPVKPDDSKYDFSSEEGITFTKESGTAPIAEYIKAIYRYALGIVGILATVVMMFAGVMWIMAGGNAERVANAKSYLTAALTGLVLALTSYLILYTVNPALVDFRITDVEDVKEIGCCPKNNTCSMTTKKQCGSSWKGKDYTCDPKTEKCILKKSIKGCCVLIDDSGIQYCGKDWTLSECEQKEKDFSKFKSHIYIKNDLKCNKVGSSGCDGGFLGSLPF